MMPNEDPASPADTAGEDAVPEDTAPEDTAPEDTGREDTDPRANLLEYASGRLARQLNFIVEIDRLKGILRRTVLTDRSRLENSAEHSWHIAVMTLVLAEHSDRKIDVLKVLKMLLVHDLVEIDAGDTFCYDTHANADKAEREERAAERIFGLLPDDQRSELRSLWDEFEARKTAESRFANALDRLQPMLHNYLTGGHSWREHGIQKPQVIERNQPIEEGSSVLWEVARRFLDDAEVLGFLGKPSQDR